MFKSTGARFVPKSTNFFLDTWRKTSASRIPAFKQKHALAQIPSDLILLHSRRQVGQSRPLLLLLGQRSLWFSRKAFHNFVARQSQSASALIFQMLFLVLTKALVTCGPMWPLGGWVMSVEHLLSNWSPPNLSPCKNLVTMPSPSASMLLNISSKLAQSWNVKRACLATS